MGIVAAYLRVGRACEVRPRPLCPRGRGFGRRDQWRAAIAAVTRALATAHERKQVPRARARARRTAPRAPGNRRERERPTARVRRLGAHVARQETASFLRLGLACRLRRTMIRPVGGLGIQSRWWLGPMAVGGCLLLKAFVDSWSQPRAPRGDVRAPRAAGSAVSSADPCDSLRDLPRGHSAHDSLAMQKLERGVRQLQESCWEQPDSCTAYVTGLEHACDAGLPLACRWLGEELRSGQHTERDQDRADDLFARQFDLVEQACAEGDRSACLGQAEMQDRGVGTTVDRAAALHLVECLCEKDASDCSFTRRLLAHDEWPVEPLPGSLLANCEAWHRWPEPVDSPLEQAFQSGSRARLVAVLDEWHSSVSP